METPSLVLNFLAPCLQPAPVQTKEPLSPAQQAFAKSLPLLPKEARAALSEIMQTGAYQWQTGILYNLAAATQKYQTEKNARLDESVALASLVQTATATLKASTPHPENSLNAVMPKTDEARDTSEENLQKARISGHIMLLLILDLEKNVIESQNITEKYIQSQKDLHDLLNDDAEVTDQSKDAPTRDIDFSVSVKELAPSVSCPWKTVLHAIALFLPKNSLLYTDDRAIAKELKQCCDPRDFFELKDSHGDALCAVTTSIGNISGSFFKPSFSSEAILTREITLAFPHNLLSCEATS